MKKKYFLLNALAAAAVMPGTASANLVLDMPPILAGNPSSTCNQATCAQQGGICCEGQCQTTNCTYCCSNQCQTTVCTTPVVTGTLNDTGITNNLSVVAGDDAEYGRDADFKTNSSVDGHAGFSFTKSGNCISDNVTGLTWSPDQGGTFAWSGIAAQVSSVNTAKLCGYSDWRAPAVKELVSIVSYHRTSPAVDNAVFTDMQNATYWTATPNAAFSTTQAWVVNFVNGNADNTVLKSSGLRLRLVRP